MTAAAVEAYAAVVRSSRPAILAVALAMVAIFASAIPASAHGGNESKKAGDLVRQAIAHIVHDPTRTEAAAEKINDAKNATDKAGVDMDLVFQAGEALDRNDFHGARTLLERSIGARPHMSRADPLPIGHTGPLATGDETGINVVTDPLAAHRGPTSSDWAPIAGLVALGVLGAYLAVRFRPHAAKVA